MVEVLILAVITGFIFIKLFKTLGKVDENNQPIRNCNLTQPYNQEAGVDIHIVSAFEASLPQEVRDVFDRTRTISSQFNPEQFLSGAQAAFEMIVKAFAKGDIAGLKPLVSREVLQRFEQEIKNKNEKHEIYENTIVKFKTCEIIHAELNNNILNITVRFITEQINLIKDNLGNIIFGDPNALEVVEDVWVFAKHLKTNNSIWELVETKNI